ncbi:MAG: hypothetical protein VR78_11120 [Hoeflea sp. BRH_c9]|nr:MAG: hypothetical protein VR78_11120 [Hoeflea sp. BRH_c9]
MAHVFVGLLKDKPYENAFLYDMSGKKFRQVLWGDWLSLADDADLQPKGLKNNSKWVWVRWAWGDPDPAKRQLLKIKREFTSSARPLEIIFVDVGIGDGAVLISPERETAEGEPAEAGEERILVIDAGKEDHMRKFLDGRFKAYREGFNFHAAILSHPDSDHYNGFGRILSTEKITFKRLYHNGIVELNSDKGLSRLGGTRSGPGGVTDYLQKIVPDDATMRSLFAPSENRKNRYASVIGKGIAKNNVGEFRMLGVNLGAKEDGRTWLPEFAPSSRRPYTIEVLGPWVEYPFGPDNPSLRVFDKDLGKTKNGHSVLLRLQFGHFSVFFGGDLNRPAEMFLLQQYAGLAEWPSSKAERDAMVEAATQRLSSDVMKSCHHGSSDVTDEFIRAVRPAAFVISSGDQDANYVHPRPDLLGRLGKLGLGDSPVLLSTELQRSTRDIDHRELVGKLTKEIEELAKCDAAAHAAANFEAERSKKLKALLKKFGELALPSVAVDGAIYVKTNGEMLITAFKKETQDPKSKWFYYAYTLTGEGTLKLIPREGEH